MSEIKNKIQESGIITIDIQSYIQSKPIHILDLKEFLYQGIVIKEKLFREKTKNLKISLYNNVTVAIFCSVDAIIPHWAYMLVIEKLNNIAENAYYGTLEEVEKKILIKSINEIDIKAYKNKKVMLKGCGNIKYPELAYTIMTKRLLPHVQSLMYGEPCSAVPIYKKKQ